MGPKSARDNFANAMPITYLGKIIVNITDSQSPSPKFSSLTLTISKAETHLIHLFIPGLNTQSPINEDLNTGNQKTNQNVNQWETLQLNENNNPIDLTLSSGQNYSLGITQLVGGKYSEIRLYISKAKAKLENGEEIELIIPGQDNIIRVARPFNIFADKITTLTLQLNKEDSVIQSGGASYFLKPFISNIAINN
jgi:hypothetical protein